MKINDIEIGIARYIKNEMIPGAPDTLTKFMLYTGSALMLGKTEKLLAQHSKMLTSLDILQGDEINLETLYAAAKEGMRATGKVEYKGMIFNEEDVDKIYQYIKQEK